MTKGQEKVKGRTAEGLGGDDGASEGNAHAGLQWDAVEKHRGEEGGEGGEGES